MDYRMALNAFEARFGGSPECVVRAPGREHTDYTGGLVLPIAINRALLIGARATAGTALEIHSTQFDQSVQIDGEVVHAEPDERWSRYVVGVIELLKRQGVSVPGTQMWIGGDLPPGAGLASSAALEVGVALALLRRVGRTLRPVTLAALCRQAEHEYAGSPCGIMDQLCCTLAKAGHALLIDCRSMAVEHVPLNLGSAAIVVIDSGVKHSIAGSAYAARRRECAAALAGINEVEPSVTSLRDVTEARIPFDSGHLDDTLVRRLRHVVTENARVNRAVDALRAGDVPVLGRLMSESHASLRDDFEVSCEELDAIVSAAMSVEGVYGARLTGGGFGGCVIALAARDAIASLEAAIHDSYNSRFDASASVVTVASADAAGPVEAC